MPLKKNQESKKIICLGCNKPYQNKVYKDGSYQTFYQNIKTHEYFCQDCLKNEPITATPNRLVFRGNKHFYQGRQVCALCQYKTKPTDQLTQMSRNQLWYCQDCYEWQLEASEAGVATCPRYTRDKELNCYDYAEKENCGDCHLCQQRQKLVGISTLVLLTELYRGRDDFNALITWEDDSFVIRCQELMWELQQVKGWTPEKIARAVNKDIFEKKLSQRKFSRGT